MPIELPEDEERPRDCPFPQHGGRDGVRAITFSLFRGYLAQLIEYGKKFPIIGNQNAIIYKETFLLLQQDKVWLGYHFGDMAFKIPDYYECRAATWGFFVCRL